MRNFLPTLLALTLLAPIATADAAVVTVEPSGTLTSNFWPLNNGTMRWQQVYDDSFFSSPTGITSIGFRSRENDSIAYGDFSIKLSTASAEPGSLSNNFDANTGTDVTTVFSGPLTINAVNGSFFAINFATQFNYDPSAGNLLVEIRHGSPTSAGSSPGILLDAYRFTPAGLERVATSNNLATAGTSFGFGELVTQFGTAPINNTVIPEPSSMLGFGFGLAAVVACRCRRRGSRKSAA